MSAGHHIHHDGGHHHQHHNHHNGDHHQFQQKEAGHMADSGSGGKARDSAISGKAMAHHQMYLATSSTSPFVFQGWSLQTIEGLLAALLLTIALAMLREAVSFSLTMEESMKGRPGKCNIISLSVRLRRTFLHVTQTAAAYTLMLGVMTYNIWIVIVLVLGSGVGYFLFRPCLQHVYNRSMRKQLHLNGNSCKTAANGTQGREALLNGHAVNDEASMFTEDTQDEPECKSQSHRPLLAKSDDIESIRNHKSDSQHSSNSCHASPKTSTKVSVDGHHPVNNHTSNSIVYA